MGKTLYFTSSLLSHAFRYLDTFRYVVMSKKNGNDDELSIIAKPKKL